MASNKEVDEDEQFNQAFGEHTGIEWYIRDTMNDIKNNDNSSKKFRFGLDSKDVLHFTNLSWALLGKYIANNINMAELNLAGCNLTNERMTSLFGGLVGSSSLITLIIRSNPFGVDGLGCMVPFLQNSPNLSRLDFGFVTLSSECFELLVSSLHNNKKVGEMNFEHCNMTDISALDSYKLPNLHKLLLNINHIGREGCTTLANQLRKDKSNLHHLDLNSANIDDEGIEMLATSLKYNTKLKILYLKGNNITMRGYRAILKMLVDVSSIENTINNSNHTLTILGLVYHNTKSGIIGRIDSAIKVNKRGGSSRETGREKVIKYQLNSQEREEMCRLQYVKYSSEDNMFADVEPKLLPKILALIGERHGQSEFYTSLLPVAPVLLSFIDRKAMIKDIIKSLTSDLDKMNNRLALIELEDSKQAVGNGDSIKEGGGGEKRQRMS